MYQYQAISGLTRLYDGLVSIDRPNELIKQGVALSAYLALEEAKQYPKPEQEAAKRLVEKINRYLDYHQ